MAALQRVEKENIEKARQLLLLEVYREQKDERFIKREAVKQLLAPLIAARESGLSFEDIAKVFEKAGLVLTPSTLRSYYFELKTEAELATSARKHAAKVAQTKRAIEQQLLEKHNRHAERVALAYAYRLNNSSTLIDTLATPKSSQLTQAELIENPVTPKQQGSKSVSGAFTKSTEEMTAAAPSASSVLSSKAGEASEAKTLQEIESLSLATDDRTTLEEDVILQGNLVRYVSGKPFLGTLSKKQIHLLRSVGKIIAPTIGRSSTDFVNMPGML